MTDAQNSKMGQKPVRDMVSLEDDQRTKIGSAGASGAPQDSLVNAAEVFEAQLEQMTAWKHQLAAQMEILRRDGIKILERQKQLAVEKKKLLDERELVSADRVAVQKLHVEIAEERARLDARTTKLEEAQAELETLQGEKEKWLEELSRARKSEAETSARRDQAAAELSKAEARLAEIRVLENERAGLEAQVQAAREALGALQTQQTKIEASRKDLELREAEVASQEKALAEQRITLLEQEVQVRGTIEQIEVEKKALHEAQRALAEESAALDRKTLETQESLAEAQRQVVIDRADAEGKLAEASQAMKKLGEQKENQERRWSALEARAAELATAEEAAARKAGELSELEQTLSAEKAELDSAQAELVEKQREVLATEQSLAARQAEMEAWLAQGNQALATMQAQLEDERAALTKARHEMQKRLEQAEAEHAEQLEMLAKQTKRLSERRGELEAATTDLQKDIEERVAKASGALKEEIARQQSAYETKVTVLGEQLKQHETAAAAWRMAEAELRQQASAAESRAIAAQESLAQVQKNLDEADRSRTDLTRELAEQVMRYEKEAEEWQRKLETAIAEGQGEEARQAAEQAHAARTELATVQATAEELRAAKASLEQRLAASEQEQAATIERLKSEAENMLARERASAEERVANLIIEVSTWKMKAARGTDQTGELAELSEKLAAAEAKLADEVSARDQEIAAWREKYEQLTQDFAAAKTSGMPAADGAATEELNTLAGQLRTMEAQRNELATQLFAVQDALQRQGEELLLTRSANEGRLVELQRKTEELEAENARWKTQFASGGESLIPPPTSPTEMQSSGRMVQHHERLLRQARHLRAYRRQVRETKATLEQNRLETAQQRDQLRMRKENLEQVKRLLEKQELVMARKLADHNALKTVAAVGIFVIMVLGSVFAGVYKFINPTFRSEATVQLAAPAGATGAELQKWLSQQTEFVRNHEVTDAAWKLLRGTDEKYAMHDGREEWQASLAKSLALQMDPQGKTLAIRYSGPDGLGVSQVCNALATALTNPQLRETSEQTKAIGAGSTVLAKATASLYPADDNRLMLSLSVVAGVLMVSLVLVIMFRHYVARQLQEIDQMADEADLADIKGELPAEASGG